MSTQTIAGVSVDVNDEGFLTRADLEAMLSERGPVTVLTHDFKRYVGAQIGVFNPSGERVGEVSHLRNREHIYVVPTAAGRRAVAGIETRLAGLG